MSVEAWYLVKLEFARVQSYLFADTQLKSMVGANARLGELLRGRLSPNGFVAGDDFPTLAQRHHARLPDGVANNAPPRDPNDPLEGADIDDPQLSWSKGVLARDGGHFFAVFSTQEDANAMVSDARDLASRQLAGLPLKAKIVPLTLVDGKWSEGKEKDVATFDSGEVLLDLPQFQVCEFSQQGPASFTNRTADGGQRRASVASTQKRATADRFADGTTHDIVGLMLRHIASVIGRPRERLDRVFTDEVSRIASYSDYLAVIHADGNSIGNRSARHRGEPKGKDFFAHEARGEAFFHSMRVTVRRAVVEAINATFAGRWSDHGFVPFRVLMLGGDDLLLVCDAAFAPTFAVQYAKALQNLKLVDDEPLKIGMGIAVLRSSFPFHRAHQLVEQLADSAKRLSKEKVNHGASAIDWLSISEGWHDDIADVRQRDAVRRINGETLVLSEKPYLILGKEGANSLDSLLNRACKAAKATRDAKAARSQRGTSSGTNTGDQEATRDAKAARSQLIALAQKLSHGRHQADWALQLVPQSVRNALAGVADESVWKYVGEGTFTTGLTDFLELHELESIRLRETEDQS